MKIGVIIDGTKVSRWQAEALSTLACEAEFVVYSCISPAPAHRRLRHGLYYLLNLVTIRNPQTRRIELPSTLRVVAWRTFSSPIEKRWQSLPRELLEAIADDRPAVIVKFGMGLLKVPGPGELRVPILSYHHGDPGRYRGRPAGFHELRRGETSLGQIVQLISNELDSGVVVASAETAVFLHSYRATLIEAYRHSALLLRPAVRNAMENKGLAPEALGPVYRLPGNMDVLAFIARRLWNSVLRLIYGALREKRWRVATAEIKGGSALGTLHAALSRTAEWQTPAIPAGYRFLADPFFHPREGLLVEGLSTTSNKGKILHLVGKVCSSYSGLGGHFSYPSVVRGDSSFLVPEVCDWSPALAYPILETGLGQPIELQVPGRPRLIDPTPFRWGEDIFLFGNIVSEGPSVLRLWVSKGLDQPFAEHPASPIRISPDGARMAGCPLELDGKLVRIGQDLRRGYGDGISLFQVIELDAQNYSEAKMGEFCFRDRKGPHTLSSDGKKLAFDFYLDAWSLLAGFRRFKERRAAGRISR